MTFIDTRKPYWEREGRGSKQVIRRIQYKLYLPNEIVAMKLYLSFQNISCPTLYQFILFDNSIICNHIQIYYTSTACQIF